MKTLIIDTNILFKYPQILTLAKNAFKVIVPDIAIEEYNNIVNKNKYYNDIIANIYKLEKNNSFYIGSSKNLIIDKYKNKNLSNIDSLIMAFIIDYIDSHKNEDVLFITDDIRLQNECKKQNISIIKSDELFKTVKIKNSDYLQIVNEKEKISRKASIIRIINIVVGIISSITSIIFASSLKIIVESIHKIIASINIWGTIILIPLIGTIFYWARSRFRLTYGIIEFFIGFTTTVLVFYPEFNISNMNLVKTLQFMGGLYIIVRSLDNVTKGLKKSPFVRMYQKWIKIFPE